MRRVVALIDGFNLYHAIDDCPHFHAFKWLNPLQLARQYVHPTNEKLIAVFFFTAVPPWNQEKRARHERLLAIYEDLGVIVKRGHFAPTTAHCRRCGEEYPTHEEKESDINLAVELLRVGFDDLADRVIVVTGDNDQAASIRYFLSAFSHKAVHVVLPPFRQAKELCSVASKTEGMSAIHLRRAMLPAPYVFQQRPKPNATPPQHWTNAPAPPPGWRPRCTQTRRCH